MKKILFTIMLGISLIFPKAASAFDLYFAEGGFIQRSASVPWQFNPLHAPLIIPSLWTVFEFSYTQFGWTYTGEQTYGPNQNTQRTPSANKIWVVRYYAPVSGTNSVIGYQNNDNPSNNNSTECFAIESFDTIHMYWVHIGADEPISYSKYTDYVIIGSSDMTMEIYRVGNFFYNQPPPTVQQMPVWYFFENP